MSFPTNDAGSGNKKLSTTKIIIDQKSTTCQVWNEV